MKKHILGIIALFVFMITSRFIGFDFTETFAIGMIILIYGFYISIKILKITRSRLIKVFSIIYGIFATAFIILFIILESIIWKDIIINKNSNLKTDANYIIVLGAGVDGDKMGSILEGRCNVGLDYLKDHSNARVICSGGQGVGEDIPESQAMQTYYENKGIDSSRILLDEKSKTTIQNLEYSKDILENLNSQNQKVIIVTNSFNILRTKIIAHELGINADYIGSNCDLRYNVNYSIREFGAIIDNYIKLKI